MFGMLDMTEELKDRVPVPQHLCWPGQEQYLEPGSLIIRIPGETARQVGNVRVMTMAGPMEVPESAIKEK
jgi:hypothetical protein